MPELPEVETIVRDLRSILIGRRLASVTVGASRLRRLWSVDWEPRMIGRPVCRIERRGKWILLVLDGGLHLVIHLGMTGQLRIFTAAEPMAPHTHVVWDLDDGREQLRFNDIRRFGSVSLLNDGADAEQFFLAAGLGPEPFDLDTKYLQHRLSSTRRCLKAVLLDQQVVAGIGNIYADETLFAARLSPTRLGRDLGPAEVERLRRAIVSVLRRAIARRGSTIRNYVGGSGLMGNYQREFRVYGRTGKPCPRCRHPIECLRLAGRSTHFCPKCQQRNKAKSKVESKK